jgi:hypothetical protein
MLYTMPNIADLYHEEGPAAAAAAVTNDGISKKDKKKSTSNGANGPSHENPKKGGIKESKKIK